MTIGTVTLIPSRLVRKVIVVAEEPAQRRSSHALPEGTTDLNAMEKAEAFVKSPGHMGFFFGPKDATTLVVAEFDTRPGESVNTAIQRSEEAIMELAAVLGLGQE